jgi:N-acetylgalactosamine PTS system EIIB component
VIALVRVDNRLVHGQIVEAWGPRFGIRRIVVADDETAQNALARAAMTLALPDDLAAEVVPESSVDWAALAASPERVLVLFREVEELRRAAGRGLSPAMAPRVNLGNVHHGPGRRPVSPSVFLREDELAALRDLAAMGFAVEARALPSDSPLDVEAMARRFQQAPG